jgi:hypothetical protein
VEQGSEVHQLLECRILFVSGAKTREGQELLA